MGKHVCFIFSLFFSLSSRGELSTKRIELKFSLKIALEILLRSVIRPVVGLQYSKIDLGYHDFHYNCIITPF